MPVLKTSLRTAALEYLGDKVKGDKMKPATYNLRLTYLRGFFGWCVDERLLTENPMRGFRVRKTDRRDVDIDPEILARLVEAPDRTTYVGARDYALILLCLDTGIRPKEAFSLTLDDIHLPALEVYVRPEAIEDQGGAYRPHAARHRQRHQGAASQARAPVREDDSRLLLPGWPAAQQGQLGRQDGDV